MTSSLLAVVPLPGAAATAVAWRSKGQLHVTVIAKATFAFAPDAEMPLAEPQAILHAEVHHGNNPSQSVRFTSDLAPFRGRADVLFTGSAHAPGDGDARSSPVRLAVLSGQEPLLDKRLLAQNSGGFRRMPIVYERALRGPTGLDNPLGLQETEGEPNIVDPARPDQAAGFGPIARAWPARKRLLGSAQLKALDDSILEIPEGFDWAYFQAAPPDQRVDFLRGDEWIVLEGLHPTQSHLRVRLPRARGVARVHGLAAYGVPDGQPLDLHADTLRIDGDEQRCSLVCRRSFPVADEAALASLWIVAGIEVAGETIEWPDALARAEEPAGAAREARGTPTPGATVRLEEGTPAAPLRSKKGELASTIEIPPDLTDLAPQKAPLPFKAAPLVATPSPYAVPSSPRDRAPRVLTGTLALPYEAEDPLAPTDVPITKAPDEPPLPELPALPESPAPLDDEREISIERCAAVAAELAEQRSRRAKVLAAHGLSEARFAEAEQRWNRAIEQEVDRGERSLRDAYDAAYVTAWEKARGRLTAAEYAGLTFAAERGELTSALSAARIRRAVWMRIQRAYRRRLEADPELAASVEKALAAARAPSAS